MADQFKNLGADFFLCIKLCESDQKEFSASYINNFIHLPDLPMDFLFLEDQTINVKRFHYDE